MAIRAPDGANNHRRLGQDEDRELITSIAVRGNKDKAIMLGGKLMVLNTTDQVILIIMVMKVMGEVTKRTKNHLLTLELN